MPEIWPCFWPFEQAALMSMPKTTMNKNYCMIAGAYNIWFPSQLSNINFKSKSMSVQPTPHHYLRFSIFIPNTGHHPASGWPIYYVIHKLLSCTFDLK